MDRQIETSKSCYRTSHWAQAWKTGLPWAKAMVRRIAGPNIALTPLSCADHLALSTAKPSGFYPCP